MKTIIFISACMVILLFTILSCSSMKPGNLGLVDNHLTECLDRP